MMIKIKLIQKPKAYKNYKKARKKLKMIISDKFNLNHILK